MKNDDFVPKTKIVYIYLCRYTQRHSQMVGWKNDWKNHF